MLIVKLESPQLGKYFLGARLINLQILGYLKAVLLIDIKKKQQEELIGVQKLFSILEINYDLHHNSPSQLSFIRCETILVQPR